MNKIVEIKKLISVFKTKKDLFIKKTINKKTEKLIDVYKTKKDYKIYPNSLNQFGFWLAISPCILLPATCEVQQLVSAIKEALCKSNNSQIFYDKDKDYEHSLQLRELRVKSWSELYRTSTSCTIYLYNNTLELTPYKREEGRRGIFPISEKVQTFSVNDFENAVLRLIEILNDNK
jgi:hypothetical protein